MASDQFRRELRQEAILWQAEELIDAALFQQLAERYQWDKLDTARDRFSTLLIGLGSLLVGLAVITFVAANWQFWGRSTKVVLLLGIFVAVNVAGFYLWQRTGHQAIRLKRLGQGLMLLGALILGASMALMAQMFHLSGSNYELFLGWSLGVVVMAYSLQFTPLGVMSVILASLSYLLGNFDLTNVTTGSVLRLLWQHMPLLAGVLWLPLAYRCRSRAIFALSTILLVISWENQLIAADTFPFFAKASIALAFALPPALLWGFDDLIWPTSTERLFQPVSRMLALVFLGVMFYCFSFHWVWSDRLTPIQNSAFLNGAPLLDTVVITGLILVEWLYLFQRARKRRGTIHIDALTIGIASLIAIAALIVLWHQILGPISIFATVVFNLLLFVFASGLIWAGLAQGKRRTFWNGMTLITLQIISRVLEYQTNLLFKSLVLFLCGISVIAAGFWFENYLARFNPTPEKQS